ncbi:hypothetical protein [Parachryseolinea silvisoli]|uniref:hypothetical protein n=1 Tax=Parachryseolinea silvisoli TaxID=2873601 RepID=UPI002265B2F0|nr:hypothetical protein [Parachryseolinea silvisoli]MCD9018645.1 hypothetical protein [Parachryseolinea silvisoli]
MRNIVGMLLLLMACAGPKRLLHRSASVGGFTTWQTGHDAQTVQRIPATGTNALVQQNDSTWMQVKFDVREYGEVSFPLANTPPDVEAPRVDLSGSNAIRITYKANQTFLVQLRQTGVHGGIQNHIELPASAKSTTVTVPFTQFTGGLKPLDLTDVAKFNFAFLSNNVAAGYAELFVYDVVIDHYTAP